MAENADTLQAASPAKRRHTARVRLDYEQTQHAFEPAAAQTQKQERRRHQGDLKTAHAGSPQRRQSSPTKSPSSSRDSRLTHHALSLGSGGGGDSRVLHTAEWLDDLRQRYGRPQATTELENQPPRGAAATPGAEASPSSRRPPDAAVLAAALAVRLQASSLEQQLPSPARHSSRGTGAGAPEDAASASRSPRHTASSASPAAAASPSRRRTTPAALSDIPLTPPRPGIPRPGRSVRRRSNSIATPATGASRSTGRRSSMSGRDLSLVEKAMVVGVGTLLYPFVRTPSTTGSSAAVPHADGTKQSVQQSAQPSAQPSTQPSGQRALAEQPTHTPAPVSNLDARLTDAIAASSPNKPADVFAATATFTPPQSPSRQAPGDTADSGTLALTAMPAAETLAASPAARSPLRTPPPLRQTPPSPVSQLGGYDEQELVTITPPPEPAGAVLPASPASAGIAAGMLTSPAPPSSNPDGLRTLRETYGSIPAAAAAEWEAFDASVAAAVAELAGAAAQPDGGDGAPAAAAGSCDADMPRIPESPARDVLGGGPAGRPSQVDSGIPAPKEQAGGSRPAAPPSQEAPRAPGSPARRDVASADSIGRVPLAAETAASLPAVVKQRGQRVPVGMLVLVLSLLSIAGIGLLASYDPAQGRCASAMAAQHARQAAAAGTAAWQRSQAAAAHAAGFARHAPAYAEQVAAEAWQGAKAAAAAMQQGIAAVPSLVQRTLKEAAAVAAADAKRVAAAAQRLAGTAAAEVMQRATAVAGNTKQIISRPTSWPTDLARKSWAHMVAALQAWGATVADSSRTAASVAVQTLQQDWRQVSAAAGRVIRRIPQSGPEVAAATAAAGSGMQRAAAAVVALATRQLHTTGAAVRQLLWPAPLPPPPSASAASRAWARITGSPRPDGGSPASTKASTPSMTPASLAAQQAALKPAKPVKRLAAPAPAAARPAPQQRTAASAANQAAASRGSLQKASKAAPAAAVAQQAAKPSTLPSPQAAAQAAGRRNASSTPPRDAAAAWAGATALQAQRTAASPAAVRSPATHGLSLAGGVPHSKEGQFAAGPAPAAGLNATATGCLAALAVCGLVAAAHWLGWLPGTCASRHKQFDGTGDDETCYGGPDADDFGAYDHLLDAVDFDAALAGGHDINPRRHTIATTKPQGREFTRLRPNELVTRPTSASRGRGLDYLWLRSRVVVRLSPEARGRVARSSTMRNLGRDTSFRSPMGVLRDIDYAPRGRRSGGHSAGAAPAAVAADEPATPVSAGAASARRASRRLTLG